MFLKSCMCSASRLPRTDGFRLEPTLVKLVPWSRIITVKSGSIPSRLNISAHQLRRWSDLRSRFRVIQTSACGYRAMDRSITRVGRVVTAIAMLNLFCGLHPNSSNGLTNCNRVHGSISISFLQRAFLWGAAFLIHKLCYHTEHDRS